MPVCKRCDHLDASVELRRSPKQDGTWLCKDKLACKRRRLLAREAQQAARRVERTAAG